MKQEQAVVGVEDDGGARSRRAEAELPLLVHSGTGSGFSFPRSPDAQNGQAEWECEKRVMEERFEQERNEWTIQAWNRQQDMEEKFEQERREWSDERARLQARLHALEQQVSELLPPGHKE